MRKSSLALLTLLISIKSFANPAVQTTPISNLIRSLPTSTSPADPLQIFRPKLVITKDHYEIVWAISPGYYLYRDKTLVNTIDGDTKRALPITFEQGESIIDELFGPQTVFRQFTVMTLPKPANTQQNHPIRLQVSFQGCQEGRLCYPPTSIDLVSDPRPPATLNQDMNHQP